MNFQDLKKIENPDFYIDVAFGRAKKKAELVRQKRFKDRLTKSKEIEKTKVSVIGDSLASKLLDVLKQFPSLEHLPPFYHELAKATLEYADVRKSLGGVNWAVTRINEFTKKYSSKIQKCNDLQKINQYRREYYGRISSLVKQIKKELQIIDNARKIMRQYPTIKTSLKTVSIAGFPNIGKTTLLSKLTGSTPDIQAYAFTTQGINVAYIKKDKTKIQVLDTPGTLNRFDRMNSIEKIAYIALKHCTDMIIYIIDLTEPYPLKQQEALLRKIKETKKPLIIYLSKSDILDKDIINKGKKKYNAITDIRLLKKEIIQKLGG